MGRKENSPPESGGAVRFDSELFTKLDEIKKYISSKTGIEISRRQAIKYLIENFQGGKK